MIYSTQIWLSWLSNYNSYEKVLRNISAFPNLFLFFSGFPQPEYRWMKDGVFLSEFSSEPFYKIRSVTKGDAGSYQCYAKNSVGTIVSEKIPLVVACK